MNAAEVAATIVFALFALVLLIGFPCAVIQRRSVAVYHIVVTKIPPDAFSRLVHLQAAEVDWQTEPMGNFLTVSAAVRGKFVLHLDNTGGLLDGVVARIAISGSRLHYEVDVDTRRQYIVSGCDDGTLHSS